jgi:hypothetical protein
MPRYMRWLSAVLVVAPLLAACTMAEENLAVVANAPGTFAVGETQRLMVGLVDSETADFLASPELPATAILTSPDERQFEAPAEFMWTIPDAIGLYLVRATFDQKGTWWVRLRPEGMGPTQQAAFTVSATDAVPGVGDPAPAVKTSTLADHPLEEISSDDEPDPALYELSLDTALSNGRPTVVVFATPAFCVSQTCGPMLDQVKAVAGAHPSANFLHVEIYENLDATSSDELIIVPAVLAWGLPSEPWVFVIDSEGNVAARFEGAMMASELEAALEAVGA